jgi:small subunit ribosomal protein S6
LRTYETTFIVDSLIRPEETEAIVNKIEKFISNNGGEIKKTDRLGKKRLAYEIKKRQYGYYVIIRYGAPPKLNRLLEKEYQLDENILRYLTIVLDPRYEAQMDAITPKITPEGTAEVVADSKPLEKIFLANEPEKLETGLTTLEPENGINTEINPEEK